MRPDPFAPRMAGLRAACFVRAQGAPGALRAARRVGPRPPPCAGMGRQGPHLPPPRAREQRVGAAGIAVSALSGLTDKEMARQKRQPFRGWSSGCAPASSPSTRCRRSTRPSTPSSSSSTTRTSGGPRRAGDAGPCPNRGRRAVAGAPVVGAGGAVGRGAVVVRRTDTDETTTLMSGRDPVELAGPVSEVVFSSRRDQVREIAFDGPEEKVGRAAAGQPRLVLAGSSRHQRTGGRPRPAPP